MKSERDRAVQPEDLTRLLVERANAGDAEGLARGMHRTRYSAFLLGR